MFGRKKKKPDLDWQPDADSEGLIEEAAEQGLPNSGVNSSNHAFGSVSHQAQQSDLWGGLIHPRSITRFLRQNVWFVAKVALVVLILGLIVFMIIPQRYGTKALVLVDPRQPNVTSSESVLSGIGGDAAALTSYVEIMNSDGFLSKVMDELGVADDPEYAKAGNRTELIGMFQSNLSANRQGATYIVEVYFKSLSKENAAKYANGVAQAFVRDQKDYRVSTNEEASRWLLERLALLQTNLTKSENAVAAYRGRTGIVDAGGLGTLDDQQLSSLVGQLATASTELAEAKARYEQAQRDGVPGSSGTSQGGEFANLDQLLQEESRLRRQAAELSQTLGSRHPRLLANTQQQRIISGQIATERGRLVQRTKQAYETVSAKKRSLESQLADARQRSIEQNKAKVELANLEREATANRNLYEQFLARYKVTDEQSQFQFNEARIVSKAPVPIKSTKPSLKLVLVVLVTLGVMLGLLAALVRAAFAIPEQRESGQHAPDPVNTNANFGYRNFERPAEYFLNAAPQVQAVNGAQDDVGLEPNAEPEEGVAMPVEDPVGRLPIEPEVQTENLEGAIKLEEERAVVLPLEDPDAADVSAQTGAVVINLTPRKGRGGKALRNRRLTIEQHKHLAGLVEGRLEEEDLCLLVTAAQIGEGLDQTTKLVTDFAIGAGFHPVVISLRDQSSQLHLVASGGQAPKRAAKVEEYETHDLIPFISPVGFSHTGGLDEKLARELAGLIEICSETYGFVILEARQILDAETLEDLLEMVDRGLLVLESSEMEDGDLDDWCDWAQGVQVGLVVNQT